MLRKPSVSLLIRLVKNQVDQIESKKQNDKISNTNGDAEEEIISLMKK